MVCINATVRISIIIDILTFTHIYPLSVRHNPTYYVNLLYYAHMALWLCSRFRWRMNQLAAIDLPQSLQRINLYLKPFGVAIPPPYPLRL